MWIFFFLSSIHLVLHESDVNETLRMISALCRYSLRMKLVTHKNGMQMMIENNELIR